MVVHQLYDAIYCIHVHSRRKELVLYQLTKEAVIRRSRLDLLTAGTSYVSPVCSQYFFLYTYIIIYYIILYYFLVVRYTL
jgi:hypothetical protein